jgi:hypothetical protein
MKRKTRLSNQPLELNDLVVSFYDVAVDYRKESFPQIARRVLPRRFKSSPAFRSEARKMFDLARLIAERRENRRPLAS